MQKYEQTIVISAVNLINGGTFTILKDVLTHLDNSKDYKSYRKIVLLNNKALFSNLRNFELFEFPLSKKHYFFRLFYEYIYFFFFSLKVRPEIWFSLHDITPCVRAHKRFVYMHNPSPFYLKEKGRQLSFKFKIFILFYKFVYKINVHNNTAIIVQQDWLRYEISKMCKYPIKHIIVAYPESSLLDISKTYVKNTFFYPAYPREFKNFEIICKACQLLEKKDLPDWKVYITLDGSENFYSKDIYFRYSKLTNLEFIGVLPLDKVYSYYDFVECLIFPSKLETWGLPISEFKNSDKKMLLANLPYAKETANGAANVVFFNPNNEYELMSYMEDVILSQYSIFTSVPQKKITSPFCRNWFELFNYMLEEY